MEKEMACIVCPMSCHLSVTTNDSGEITAISGNTCPRGEKYARNEMTHPMRMLTSTVKLVNGRYPRLPVITSTEIPKEKMTEVMKEINNAKVYTPVRIGDIIIKNVCGLSSDIVASRSMEEVDQRGSGEH